MKLRSRRDSCVCHRPLLFLPDHRKIGPPRPDPRSLTCLSKDRARRLPGLLLLRSSFDLVFACRADSVVFAFAISKLQIEARSHLDFHFLRLGLGAAQACKRADLLVGGADNYVWLGVAMSAKATEGAAQFWAHSKALARVAQIPVSPANMVDEVVSPGDPGDPGSESAWSRV